MPENKRQHFVPQFYLRGFAGPGGGTLGVFNLKSGRFIGKGKLKGQAAKAWLYGADGEAEAHFSRIEGAAASAIRRILNTGRPPKRFDVDHYRLITFIMLQMARTPAAASATNRQVDAIAKSLLRQQEPSDELLAALDRVKISDGNALASTIEMALVGAPAVYDLDFKLFENVSATPFVTSDHPVSLHNRLVEGAVDIVVTGLGVMGLQIWLPLSPTLGLMFYDEHAYRVGRPDSRIVRIASPVHAARLNALTWWGADENIYAAPDTDPVLLAAASEAITPLRTPVTEWVDEEVLERTETTKRVRVAYRRSSSPLRLDLPFLRPRVSVPDLRYVQEIPMRRPDWMRDLMAWTQMLRNGSIDFDTFERLTLRVPQRNPLPKGDPSRRRS